MIKIINNEKFSGAGKTTLLNVLMDRNMKGLEMEGTVKVNGNEIGQSISLISGFAQQQEIFVPTLTVDEYLMIQVKKNWFKII